MKFKGIAFTRYPITDVVRAREFYEAALGLKATDIYKGKQNIWIEYDIGSGTLALVSGNDISQSTAEGTCVALELADDFDEAIKSLKLKGVKFVIEPHATGVCRNATIADPDGNLIVIHKRKQ